MADTSNPYAAPHASVADSDAKSRGRPLLVWVITIFLGLGVTAAVGATIAGLSGLGGEAFAAYISRISPLQHATNLTGSALTAWALVELFRLKRRALPVFVSAFAFGLAVFGFKVMLLPEYRSIFEGADSWKLTVRWTVNLAIIAYIWRLHARGTLTR